MTSLLMSERRSDESSATMLFALGLRVVLAVKLYDKVLRGVVVANGERAS